MRILVVEDERALGRQIAGGLREERHVVDLVHDGLTALDYGSMLREGCYDAVVLDVLLPGCDGLTVCRRWRASGLRMPILMLTARSAVEERVRGLDAGADDYMVKPFAFSELQARLRALARREPNLQMGTLRAGDLVMDAQMHRVERAGRPIHLTVREFSILELLLRHQGQVLSRERIASGAWDLEAEHASNVVDVFIRNLRRKIDEPFAHKLLETVRGVGYTIRPLSEAMVPQPVPMADTRAGYPRTGVPG